MDPVILEALKKSIEHWRENESRAEKGLSIDISSSSCALCRVVDPHVNGCGKCPVCLNSGKGSCVDTPYEEVVQFYDETRDFLLLGAVRKEREFLESLLPAPSELLLEGVEADSGAEKIISISVSDFRSLIYAKCVNQPLQLRQRLLSICDSPDVISDLLDLVVEKEDKIEELEDKIEELEDEIM